MSNVLLKDLEERINIGILNYNNKSFNNFRIAENIWFNDDIWDFNNFNISKREKFQYRFNFEKIDNSLVFGTKMMILNRIGRKNIRFSTAKQNYNAMLSFSNFCRKNNICDIRLININLLKEYFEDKINRVSNLIKQKRANTLIEVLEMYNKFLGYEVSHLVEYLKKYIKDNTEKKDITSKNKYIPDVLLNEIVSLAVKDLNDELLSIRDRIVAGLIIMLAEVGMRIEEASMLENNRIKSIGKNCEKAYYLEFYTFKITKNGEDKKLTNCFLTDLSYYTYNKLCELRGKIINNLSNSTKMKLLLKTDTDGNVVHIKDSEVKRIISSYSEEKIEKLNREINRFIFIDEKTGMQKRGATLLRSNIEEFFIRHEKEFNELSLKNNEIEEFRTLSVTSEGRYLKYFKKQQRIANPFNVVKNKKYIHVNPHCFRVTVCTKLFKKGIHLDYIVKHLNHLSEDMTLYYNKSLEFEKKLENTLNIFMNNSNEDGLIETSINNVKDKVLKEELRSDKFKNNIDKINKFIKKNNFNINMDMEKIFKDLKKIKSPVIENSLGICVVSVVQRICEKRRYFSTLEDNYYIGIQLDTYKNLNCSYERVKQKLKVIKHNKEIAKINPVYKNEYEREVNALSYYIKKTVKFELSLLEEDILKRGKDIVVKENPQLTYIVNNFSIVREEIFKWI